MPDALHAKVQEIVRDVCGDDGITLTEATAGASRSTAGSSDRRCEARMKRSGIAPLSPRRRSRTGFGPGAASPARRNGRPGRWDTRPMDREAAVDDRRAGAP